MPEEQRSAFLAVGRKVSAEVRRLCFDTTPPDAYRAITAPTQIVSGARSPAAERRVCEILVETMPRSELVTIAGAGHMGPLTHADEVNSRIAAHVRAELREELSST